jgi:HEAT repeats
MRAKVVMIIAGLGLLISGALFTLRQNSARSTTRSNPPPSETVSAAKTEPAAEAPALVSRTIHSETKEPIPSEEAHKTYVEQRSSQLMDLAMNDDRASLDTILSELTNRDPEIRKAALEAAIQFGSRDAIPKLADAASQTDDPNEKAALNDAIEFLKLPSLTEINAQSPKPVGNAHAPKPAHKITVGKRVLPPATANP